MLLENQYIVVADYNMESQRIFYNGSVEIDAFKVLKNVQFHNKRLFKANVKMCKMFDHDLIEAFEVIERIA
ncbi:hypothetical protein [Clostridium sp.]|jgi:hypothetical protein|uniref:hypothetical protein n=1 Tax=Clostridium sp. TaxID=1506 RepID=UPI0035A1CE54